MWEQHRRDARVVVDHLSLGELDLWIQNLVEIRELEPPALYFHLYAALGGHRPCGSRWAPRSGSGLRLGPGLALRGRARRAGPLAGCRRLLRGPVLLRRRCPRGPFT